MSQSNEKEMKNSVHENGQDPVADSLENVASAEPADVSAENQEQQGDRVAEIISNATNMTDEELDQMIAKVEVEAQYRDLKGIVSIIVTVIAVAMGIFHFWLAGFSPITGSKARIIHLAFALCLTFLIYPISKKWKKLTAYDLILAVLGATVNIYLFLNVDRIAMNAGALTTLDLIMGGLTIVLVVIGARRAIGPALSIIAVVMLLYAYFGPYLPGFMQHRGYSIERLINHLYISLEGIFGTPLGTTSSYVFLFVMFGVFLSETGLSEFLTNAAMCVAGTKPGGPAKMAIVASGFFGMISGSAPANVVTTGAFTIPLMKEMGYKSHFAGAVEAVASTGGQIMPPVMGTAAFIMAEILGISYRSIIFMAIIPAILYYVSLWFFVDLEARKCGLNGLKKEQLPKLRESFKTNAIMLLPVILMLVLILESYTAYFAAFWSTVLLVVLSMFNKKTRLNPKKLVNAIVKGVKQTISVSMATAVVGIVIGIVNLTGLGLQLANLIITLSGGHLIITMFLTMLACFVLGMGLPTSAAYIVAAAVAPTAMVKLGVPIEAAHMFIFYYACLSSITPPVALASFAASGLCGAPSGKVGWTAVRLGIIGFIVPYMFVYSPELLMQGEVYRIIIAFCTSCIGAFCLATAFQGYFRTNAKWYVRVLMGAASLLLIDSGLVTDAIGFGCIALSYVLQTIRLNKERNMAKLNA